MDHFIKVCFQSGFTNKEILEIFACSENIVMSISTLKRKLKSLGLFRRKHHSNLLEVAQYIMSEMETTGVLHGYRWMHLKCKQAGYNVPRDIVYGLMRLLDPDRMQRRLRGRLRRRQYSCPGPNFVWHIDSYDKLKPFGIAINGCIDGYSRYVVWLEAATTNSDPKVIASYYIQSVKENGGCPKRIRTDLGTENTYIEKMQVLLRREHLDEFSGERSYLSGKSTHNQRIEWFWGLLRKEMGQYFMDLFSVLGSDVNDLYRGDIVDKNLVQFCFLEVIQANLDELRRTWNTHAIRTKSSGNDSGRRPILMYTVPQIYHVEDHLCPVDDNKVMVCAEETVKKS